MKRTLPLAFVVTFLACSAFGANSPVVVHTFVCNGNPSQRVGACPNGAQPSSLIRGSDGNFYGTAVVSSEGQGLSGGTVFSLTPAGKFTLLHAFSSKNNFADGRAPISLTESPDGNLYGLTMFGGNGPATSFPDYGVVFRISKTGSGFQVIHQFCSVGICIDGGPNAGALRVGTDGNIYGATSEGGTGANCPQPACGTIFRITPSSGAYEVASSFSLSANGLFPYGLTPASDGTLYGITNQGGMMFHFTPATGVLQSTKLSFPFAPRCNGDGCPASALTAIGANGNLYGLYNVYNVGESGLYEVQPDGSHLQLFPEYNTTLLGGGAVALLLASDGNFWIPESVGGSGNGDIISLSPSDGKVLQTLAPFRKSAQVGALPSVLIQAPDGTLWGATSADGVVPKGHFGGGTIFSLNAGLPPR